MLEQAQPAAKKRRRRGRDKAQSEFAETVQVMEPQSESQSARDKRLTYLYGGQFREIAHTVVNAVAIASGMICDGAKASCAAKIASAVEAGLLGMQMQMHESQFYGGDGIVVKGVENTIRNIGTLASEGMRETDRTIIRMMIQEH